MGYFSLSVGYALIYAKNVLGCILWVFLTISSGHPINGAQHFIIFHAQ
jgi:hypothetical protein